MAIRDLIPWGRHENANRAPMTLPERSESPLSTLHREMNRLFDDALRGWDLPALAGTSSSQWSWPHVEVAERGNALRVTAELPGLSERDLELSVDDNILMIRGERRQENEDKDRGYTERFYGRFERRIALPSGVEVDKPEATFRDGVLTVTLPRSAEADDRRRITINAATKH